MPPHFAATHTFKEESQMDYLNKKTIEDINVSGKVVKIIQSYTGVVDKFVWRK